jgi:hypothetical protein
MMTFDDIAINHVMLGKVANRDEGGEEGRKCPKLVHYIVAVARTKQAWSG